MLTAGTRLGAYEILAPLGAGGMGEVYRARDPRLDRDVAIKVLPASFAADAVTLQRFEREAMSVAKLSHPNILAIYEFAKDAGTVFVVMELIEGETLRAKLANGALPPRKAIGYALQMARGIAAAHARDIVHRDLKPENMMITKDEHVKLLDFGLAKPVDAARDDMTRAADLSAAGTIAGTVGYMAPEQVRGQAVDRRADIFAFGAVLYEMLSGERAFKGDTPADTMTAVLTKEPPDLDLAQRAISPSLDRIVRRCLEKHPDLRFQSANDLAFALDTLSGVTTASNSSAAAAPASIPATQARRSSSQILPWFIAGAAVIAAVATVAMRGSRAATDPHWSTFTRVTEAAGEEIEPSLSPDGNTVAYTVQVNDNWDIYSQRVGGRNAAPLVNDPARNEGGPAFSPDGLLLAFHQNDGNGGVFIAGATGESVRRLTDFGFHPAWSPDGKQVAFSTERIITPSNRQTESYLYVVDQAGGTPKKIVERDACQPSWSPSGTRIVYWSNDGGQRDIYTVASGGGERVAITKDAAIDWSPVWSPDGRFIYFSSDRGGVMNLWRVAIDESTGRSTGDPEPVTTGVMSSMGRPAFAHNGARLAFQAGQTSINPVAIPFDPATGKAGTPVVLDTRNNIRMPSSVSADGKLLAYFSLGEQQEDIFISPVSGGPITRVTDDAPRDRAARFSPDGKKLYFYSTRSGTWQVWSIGIDGGDLRQVTNDPAGVVYPLLSPDGQELIYSQAIGAAVYRGRVPANGLMSAAPLPNGSAAASLFLPSSWSPDGRLLAGNINNRGGQPIAIGAYDIAQQKLMRFADGDDTYSAQWLPDSRHLLYFFRGGSLLALLDTSTGKRTIVDVKLPGPSANDVFAVLQPSGRTIYYGAQRRESDIWVVDQKTK